MTPVVMMTINLVTRNITPHSVKITLKHVVVDYYRSHGSYVSVSFLDLSKAFYNVDHTCLFKQFVKLKPPDNVVKLLINVYSNQLMNIRWKQIQSDSFYMKNGTRHGSVLSPYIFTVYMRRVTKDVIRTGRPIGCHIGNKPVCTPCPGKKVPLYF